MELKNVVAAGVIDDPGKSKLIWNTLWRLNTHQKVRNFIWSVVNEALPVKSMLKARNITVDDACVKLLRKQFSTFCGSVVGLKLFGLGVV